MVQNARNLMTVVLKAMTAAEAVCVKVGIYQFIIYVHCMSTDVKHTNYIPYHRAYQMYTTIHYHQTYQLYHYPLPLNIPTVYHYPLPSNIPIISTTIKHIFYMGYKWTYQQYPPSLSIPIISASIEHTNDIHNHWLNQLYHYPLPLNNHRTHRLPLNIPSITGGRGLNIDRFVVHMSTVMCWKSSRYWTIFLLC